MKILLPISLPSNTRTRFACCRSLAVYTCGARGLSQIKTEGYNMKHRLNSAEFGALMRRCRQNKFAIIGSKSDTDDPQGAQVSAHVDPAQITANIGDMKMRVAGLSATL